jgi:hypothetical protein
MTISTGKKLPYLEKAATFASLNLTLSSDSVNYLEKSGQFGWVYSHNYE